MLLWMLTIHIYERNSDDSDNEAEIDYKTPRGGQKNAMLSHVSEYHTTDNLRPAAHRPEEAGRARAFDTLLDHLAGLECRDERRRYSRVQTGTGCGAEIRTSVSGVACKPSTALSLFCVLIGKRSSPVRCAMTRWPGPPRPRQKGYCLSMMTRTPPGTRWMVTISRAAGMAANFRRSADHVGQHFAWHSRSSDAR